MFQVCKTSADMTQDECVFESASHDVAETIMVNCYKQSGFSVDYMLYDTERNDMVGFCFTADTVNKLGIA